MNVARSDTPRIVIAGGGCAGWMAATMLAPLAANGTRVVVVDGGTDAGQPVAAALMPATKRWHATLGIDEHDMLRATRGTYRLGALFDDWPGSDGAWALPFGDYGSAVDGVEFLDLWWRADETGAAGVIGDYNLAQAAMRRGRFTRPNPDRQSMLDYGYHVDRALYRAYLRDRSLKNGVVTAGSVLRGVERNAVGQVAALVLEDGSRLSGDFYIDATDDGQVVEAVAGTDQDREGRSRFPAVDLVSVDAPADPAMPPFSTHRAQGGLSLSYLPLQGNGEWRSCHSAEHRADAPDALKKVAGTDETPRRTTIRSGRRSRSWVANCVAIGASAGQLDPIVADPIDLARIGLQSLRDRLPRGPDSAVLAHAHNIEAGRQFDALQDFTSLLRSNPHDGEWPGDSPRLTEIVALFQVAGRLPQGGPIGPARWLAALTGRGVRPACWSPLADIVAADRLEQTLGRLRGLIAQSAESMPRHADYIARYCDTAVAA